MIGIRADANDTIALGHIMRCISIAIQIKELGHDVIFILSDTYACSFLDSYNMKYIVLGSVWNDKEAEIDKLSAVTGKMKIDILLVDSYEVTTKYLAELKKHVKTVYLDDLCKEAYDVDMLINYSRADAEECYESLYCRAGKMPHKLAGIQYTPIKKEFAEYGAIYEQNAEVTDILVTTGGTDPKGISCRVLEKLCVMPEIKDINIHVIIGPFYSNELIEKLEETLKKSKAGVTVILHRNVTNIASIASRCQVAVSAAGTTLLELCAVGVACVGIALNDSQKPLVTYLYKHEAIDMGICDDCERIADSVLKMVNSYDMRKSFSLKARKVNDGKGAMRIARALCFGRQI